MGVFRYAGTKRLTFRMTANFPPQSQQTVRLSRTQEASKHATCTASVHHSFTLYLGLLCWHEHHPLKEPYWSPPVCTRVQGRHATHAKALSHASMPIRAQTQMLHVCIFINTHKHIYIHICIQHVYTYMYMSISILKCYSISIIICIYIYSVYTHTYLYLYIYIYIHISSDKTICNTPKQKLH